MKSLTGKVSKYWAIMCACFMMAIASPGLVHAKLDVDVNVNKNPAWYSQWWIWVIIGLVFVVLLVAIVSRGKKS